MKRMMILALALTMGVATAGAAGLDLPHGKWWENERLVERIGLSEAQQSAIGTLVFEHTRRMIDLNAALKKAELDLADLVERDTFDATAVRKAFNRFQDARRQLENERFEMLVAVRENLSAEQWNQLLEIRRMLDRERDSRRPGVGVPDRRAPQALPRGGGRQPVDGGWQ